MPHTEALRTVERLSRTDTGAIGCEYTIDDSNVYTEPWSGGFNLRWGQGTELFECVCQQSNYADELMVGAYDSIAPPLRSIPEKEQ